MRKLNRQHQRCAGIRFGFSAAVCLFGFFAFADLAPARTIDWGGGFLDVNVQSDGLDITASFSFELGTFGAFVPDETNLALWAANWKVFDTATYNAPLKFFTSTVQADVDVGDPAKVISSSYPAEDFDIGEQAYLWVYNTQSINPATEWALITDNSGDADDWTLPDPGDQSTEPLRWRISNATAAVFGGVNSVSGPGERTGGPPVFDIQTHMIPESSTVLLLVAAAGLFAGRRRRQ